MVTKQNLRSSIEHAFGPYDGCIPPPTEEQLQEYRTYLEAAGFGKPDEQIEDIYDQLINDLGDDFTNCGGSVLNRLTDCKMIWPLLDEEQREELVTFLTDSLYEELTNWIYL